MLVSTLPSFLRNSFRLSSFFCQCDADCSWPNKTFTRSVNFVLKYLFFAIKIQPSFRNPDLQFLLTRNKKLKYDVKDLTSFLLWGYCCIILIKSYSTFALEIFLSLFQQATILIGIRNVHFACGDKMNQIEAQNTAGVVSPASICNEDMVHFSSMEVDNSISFRFVFK